MKKFSKRYSETAKELEVRTNFARYTQTALHSGLNDVMYFNLTEKYFKASFQTKKMMITKNNQRIKLLKARLKNYSYRLEMERNPLNVIRYRPFFFDHDTVEDEIKHLIHAAKEKYSIRKVAERLNGRLILVSGVVGGDVEIEVTPFSIFEDVLNHYQQIVSYRYIK